jgi:hypothetical protein
MKKEAVNEAPAVAEVSKLDELKAKHAAALDALSAAHGVESAARAELDAELARIDAEERALYGTTGNRYIHDVKAYQARQKELRAIRAELSPIDQALRQKRASAKPTGFVNTSGV